jgi:hypothetical protein
MLGERGVGMGGRLGAQLRVLLRANLGNPPGARSGGDRAALAARLLPAANRPGIDAKPVDDLSHRPPGVHGGQGSFTEIGGVMRALHRTSLPDGHFIRNPL